MGQHGSGNKNEITANAGEVGGPGLPTRQTELTALTERIAQLLYAVNAIKQTLPRADWLTGVNQIHAAAADLATAASICQAQPACVLEYAAATCAPATPPARPHLPGHSREIGAIVMIALHLADLLVLQRDHPAVAIVLRPHLAATSITPDETTWDSEALLLTCPDAQADALLAVIRTRVPSYTLRAWRSVTGKNWRRV